jgi:hypothetical protein
MIQFKTYTKNQTFTIETEETEKVLKFLSTFNLPIFYKIWAKYAVLNKIKYKVLDEKTSTNKAKEIQE